MHSGHLNIFSKFVKIVSFIPIPVHRFRLQESVDYLWYATKTEVRVHQSTVSVPILPQIRLTILMKSPYLTEADCTTRQIRSKLIVIF